MNGLEKACKNTDIEIWRKVEGDYYSPSIHMTKDGTIGINVGGYVVVASIEDWHEALAGKRKEFRRRRKNEHIQNSN